MNIKNHENQKYVKLGITLAVVILVGLVFYFLFRHSAGISGFFNKLLNILMPFIYGAVLAYLLSPLCNRLEKALLRVFPKKKGLASGLSIVLSYVVAFLVVLIIFMLLIPNLVQSILQLITTIPTQLNEFSQWVHALFEQYPQLQESWDSISANLIAKITSWLQNDLSATIQQLLTSLVSTLAGIFNLVKNCFLGILISVYMLGSRKKFAVQAKLLLCGIFPKRAADMIEEEVRYADKMFNGFLIGRVIDSVIVGIICFVFSLLCGFDSAILISVIVGITNIIPVFGPFLGAIPSALLLLLENPFHCIIFLVFIVILQQVDGNLIGPRILGQTTGVSSFWVLFAVMLFGGLWGILGMIIGVPLFAVIYDIIRKLAYWGLRVHKREDLTS